ncbi:halogenase [Raoultella planticola]|uniref:Tryptophan 7-halogenase n=1 Tax=Klebsiella electrica TaxID=1259973 RepID=A0AAJ5QVW8_9ENTR|nr:tryptophan 7-halogenase [Klebsiella electrica]WBW62008.1 tryptophan 7-halogenase [Klebsiella electrica]BBV74666.1 halogenase [Raoultella planticola]
MGKNKLVIIGNGIVGNLAALYISKKLPELEITIVGKSEQRRAIVGESTVELSTHFFEGLGLGKILEDKHYHKYGLTYYFKVKNDPENNDYVVHEAPGVIRLPAYNLNRFTFDNDLRQVNAGRKIKIIEGTVHDVSLKAPEQQYHILNVKTVDGETTTLNADWFIDCSGTRRFLVKKLGLEKAPAYQRSSFWFRLKKFDRAIFDKINMLKNEHHCYDPYYVTHHFYGKGYWIWMIPMRSSDGETMMSIGYTYRPELGSNIVKTYDDFLVAVGKDHPIITELVQSGEIHTLSGDLPDITGYRDYMYESKKYYSKDGWFIIGDAAFLFDPINSLGLSYVSHMICQVAAIISKDREGDLTDTYIDCHERHIQAILSLQDSWGKWYEFMHDPVKMSWTLLMNNMSYFNVLLPTFINGGFLDGRHINVFADLFKRQPVEMHKAAYPFPKLLDILSEQVNDIDLTSTPNLYSKNIPFELYRADEKLRKKLLARYFLRLITLRTSLIRRIHWQLNKRHLTVLCSALGDNLSDLFRMISVCLFSHEMVKYHEPNNSNATPFGQNGEFLNFDKNTD